jgi:hypothetical protein
MLQVFGQLAFQQPALELDESALLLELLGVETALLTQDAGNELAKVVAFRPIGLRTIVEIERRCLVHSLSPETGG